MSDSGKNLERRIKIHLKGKQQKYFAVCQPGLESISLKELINLGVNDCIIHEGGIEFSGELEKCWELNLRLRTVSSIMLRIQTFKSIYFHDFQERISKIPWELYLNPSSPLKFKITCHHCKLYHTIRLESECIKGISQRFKETDVHNEDLTSTHPQKIIIRGEDDIFTVSLDSSGDQLYKRGYKEFVTEAPLRETVAAAILQFAEFEKYSTLLDPMCGSGTFTLEAASIISGRTAGNLRNFAFEEWPSFRETAYNNLKKNLSNNIKPDKLKIIAADIDDNALSACRENVANLDLPIDIEIKKNDFFTDKIILSEQIKTLIVLNPPYGKRISIKSDTNDFYKKLHDTLITNYNNCAWAIIVPEEIDTRIFAGDTLKKFIFRNGGIKVAVILKEEGEKTTATFR